MEEGLIIEDIGGARFLCRITETVADNFMEE